MSLHPASVRLSAQLESSIEEQPALKDMAAYARRVRASQNLAAAPESASRVTSLFSWLENAAAAPIKKLVTKAESLGIAIPFDREITRIEGQKASVRTMRLQLQSLKTLQLGRILAQKTPAGDLFVTNMSREVSIATDNLNRATALLDRAQATAQNARKQIAAGSAPAQFTAIYLVQKKMADTASGRAISGAQTVAKNILAYVKSPAATGSPTAMSYVRAVGSGASGVASFAANEAEAVGTAIQKSAPGAIAALQYWPYALGVGAALYLYAMLPKANKS